MDDFDKARWPVIAAFSGLPDESWGYVVAWLMQQGQTSGGFRPDSKIALRALSDAARAYFDNEVKKSDEVKKRTPPAAGE